MANRPRKRTPPGSEVSTLTAAGDELPERWSIHRKTELVLRLLRGEGLDTVSRESQVPGHELEGWKRAFLDAGGRGLRTRSVGRIKGLLTERLVIGSWVVSGSSPSPLSPPETARTNRVPRGQPARSAKVTPVGMRRVRLCRASDRGGQGERERLDIRGLPERRAATTLRRREHPRSSSELEQKCHAKRPGPTETGTEQAGRGQRCPFARATAATRRSSPGRGSGRSAAAGPRTWDTQERPNQRRDASGPPTSSCGPSGWRSRRRSRQCRCQRSRLL